jgi:hypothetical protein
LAKRRKLNRPAKAAKPEKPKRPLRPSLNGAAPESPTARMARVNAEIGAFMVRKLPDPDRRLRVLLMTMHINVQWDVIKGSPQPRLVSDRELDLAVFREAGIDVLGR